MLGIAPPKEEAPQVYEVWQEHWPALQLFLGCRTQWRIIAGMAGSQYQGLDYAVVFGHPRYACLETDEQIECLEQLQHIEAGALEVLNQG